MPRGSAALATSSGNAVHLTRIATGQIIDDVLPPGDEGKDPAAVALGRNGGKARAEAVSAKRRAEIARKAARTRWKNRYSVAN